MNDTVASPHFNPSTSVCDDLVDTLATLRQHCHRHPLLSLVKPVPRSVDPHQLTITLRAGDKGTPDTGHRPVPRVAHKGGGVDSDTESEDDLADENEKDKEAHSDDQEQQTSKLVEEAVQYKLKTETEAKMQEEALLEHTAAIKEIQIQLQAQSKQSEQILKMLSNLDKQNGETTAQQGSAQATQPETPASIKELIAQAAKELQEGENMEREASITHLHNASVHHVEESIRQVKETIDSLQGQQSRVLKRTLNLDRQTRFCTLGAHIAHRTGETLHGCEEVTTGMIVQIKYNDKDIPSAYLVRDSLTDDETWIENTEVVEVQIRGPLDNIGPEPCKLSTQLDLCTPGASIQHRTKHGETRNGIISKTEHRGTYKGQPIPVRYLIKDSDTGEIEWVNRSEVLSVDTNAAGTRRNTSKRNASNQKQPPSLSVDDITTYSLSLEWIPYSIFQKIAADVDFMSEIRDRLPLKFFNNPHIQGQGVHRDIPGMELTAIFSILSELNPTQRGEWINAITNNVESIVNSMMMPVNAPYDEHKETISQVLTCRIRDAVEDALADQVIQLEQPRHQTQGRFDPQVGDTVLTARKVGAIAANTSVTILEHHKTGRWMIQHEYPSRIPGTPCRDTAFALIEDLKQWVDLPPAESHGQPSFHPGDIVVVTEKIGRIPQNTPGTVVEVISQGTRDEQCVVTCAVGGGEVERPVPVSLLKPMDDDEESQDSDDMENTVVTVLAGLFNPCPAFSGYFTTLKLMTNAITVEKPNRKLVDSLHTAARNWMRGMTESTEDPTRSRLPVSALWAIPAHMPLRQIHSVISNLKRHPIEELITADDAYRTDPKIAHKIDKVVRAYWYDLVSIHRHAKTRHTLYSTCKHLPLKDSATTFTVRYDPSQLGSGSEGDSSEEDSVFNASRTTQSNTPSRSPKRYPSKQKSKGRSPRRTEGVSSEEDDPPKTPRTTRGGTPPSVATRSSRRSSSVPTDEPRIQPPKHRAKGHKMPSRSPTFHKRDKELHKLEGYGGTVHHRGLTTRDALNMRKNIKEQLTNAWSGRDFTDKMTILCALNNSILELAPSYDEAVAKFVVLVEARHMVVEAKNDRRKDWMEVLDFITRILKASGIHEKGTDWIDNSGEMAYEDETSWPNVLDMMTEEVTELTFKEYYLRELRYMKYDVATHDLEAHYETFNSYLMQGGFEDGDLIPAAEEIFLQTIPPSAQAAVKRKYTADKKDHMEVGTWVRHTPLRHMYLATHHVLSIHHPNPSHPTSTGRRGPGGLRRHSATNCHIEEDKPDNRSAFENITISTTGRINAVDELPPCTHCTEKGKSTVNHPDAACLEVGNFKSLVPYEIRLADRSPHVIRYFHRQGNTDDIDKLQLVWGSNIKEIAVGKNFQRAVKAALLESGKSLKEVIHPCTDKDCKAITGHVKEASGWNCAIIKGIRDLRMLVATHILKSQSAPEDHALMWIYSQEDDAQCTPSPEVTERERGFIEHAGDTLGLPSAHIQSMMDGRTQ